MKKLENWLFYLFLFAIPISLRHIFWFEPFNFVEWTAVYIYATDIIFGILLIFWAFNSKREMVLNPDPGNQSRRFPQLSWAPFRYWVKDHLSLAVADIFLIIFVAVAFLSIWNALDVQTAVFQWIKLVEGVALYFYIKDYALKRFKLAHAFEAIVVGATFQAVIAITQFMTQGSLGLKYLGESPLAPAFTSIAAFLVEGVKVMRAYGTTPHSNVLALYLFIALGVFYSIAIYQKRDWWWHMFHVLILWAFLLTFSRVIIGLWLVTFIIRSFLIRFYPRFRKEFYDNPEMRRRSLKIFYTTVAVGILFIACYWPYVINRSSISTNDEAIQLRILYNRESLSSSQNLLGLGMGNFVPWLMTQNLHLNREVYQPVHNIYLLIYAETGIVGIALFILFLALLLYNFYRRTHLRKSHHVLFGLVVVSILIFGLFDHYLWTIQSSRLIFFIILGLLAGAE